MPYASFLMAILIEWQVNRHLSDMVPDPTSVKAASSQKFSGHSFVPADATMNCKASGAKKRINARGASGGTVLVNLLERSTAL
jgi:hypothetical protein